MKSLVKKMMFMGAALILTAAQASAQQMPDIPVDKEVRIGKLENGLTYYIRHNAYPEKQADFYIAQNVGAILEEDNQRGLAHFLEHMCFNGTTHFPENSLISYMESIGVRFGVNLNANTGIDQTIYNISNVPAVREGIVDSCLLVLHDWANDLTLDPKEIDSERKVIHEEWRSQMPPVMRMLEKSMPTLFPGSKYAYRMPIGTMEIIDNFPYQALRDYYEKWYRPDQQAVVVVGDIDVDQIENKIKALFSSIEMPANAAPRTSFPIPDNEEPIVVVEKDKEQSNFITLLMFKQDPAPMEVKKNMAYLLMQYMEEVIPSMINQRLHEIQMKADAPFAYAECGQEDALFGTISAKRSFTVNIVPKGSDVKGAVEAVLQELMRARQFGFTASEYDRARAEYLSQLEKAYNNRNQQETETFAVAYVDNFLKGNPIPGIENQYNILKPVLSNIPVEAVNQVIAQIITDKNMLMAALCPDREGITLPTEAELKEVINKAKSEKLEAYVDNTINEPLMTALPKPGKIAKEKSNPTFGTTELTLSNGAKVILKKTDFKNDEILVQVFSKGGSSLYGNEDIANLLIFDDVTSSTGIGKFSSSDLNKLLSGKQVSFQTFLRQLTEGGQGSATPKELETLFQLIYLNFTAPREDADAFNAVISNTKSALENQAANPQKAFMDSLTVTLGQHHPRCVNLTTSMLDKADYKRIMQIYKERFANAADFTFIFTGNFEQDSIRPLITRYLASLPAKGKKENYRDLGIRTPKGICRNIFTREMQVPQTLMGIFWNGDCDYTLKNKVLASITSQILTTIYLAEVREKEGATYSISGSMRIDSNPVNVSLQVVAPITPEKSEKAASIVIAETEKLAQQGPTEELLAKAKEYLLKQAATDARLNGYWANGLKNYEFDGVDLMTDYAKVAESITAADVQAFISNLLKQNNRTEVIMNPTK